MRNRWIKIKPGGLMPKKNEIVDIWTDKHDRLTNYQHRKNFLGQRGNNFFEPTQSGPSCVRYNGSENYTQATHWRYAPKPPLTSRPKK